MKINTLEDFQEFLKDNWNNISDTQFQALINKFFGCGMVYFRRNKIEDELTYMNGWYKGDNKFGYGGNLGAYTVNELFNTEGEPTDYRRSLYFKN